MTTKLCKDCCFFLKEKTISELPKIVIQNACSCPEVTTATNPVTGEIRKNDYVDAMTARTKGYCTLEAKFFKTKITNIAKIDTKTIN